MHTHFGALINLDLNLCVKSSLALVMILHEIAGSAGDERGNKYNLIQIWLWWSKLGCGPLAKYSFPETNGRCILWRPSLQFPLIIFYSLFRQSAKFLFLQSWAGAIRNIYIKGSVFAVCQSALCRGFITFSMYTPLHHITMTRSQTLTLLLCLCSFNFSNTN